MKKRRVPESFLLYRQRYQERLETIPALSNDARMLLSAKGFLHLFLEIRTLFPSYEEAYEYLESQHERITGERMYSEYDSFRRGYLRWKKGKI